MSNSAETPSSSINLPLPPERNLTPPSNNTTPPEASSPPPGRDENSGSLIVAPPPSKPDNSPPPPPPPKVQTSPPPPRSSSLPPPPLSPPPSSPPPSNALPPSSPPPSRSQPPAASLPPPSSSPPPQSDSTSPPPPPTNVPPPVSPPPQQKTSPSAPPPTVFVPPPPNFVAVNYPHPPTEFLPPPPPVSRSPPSSSIPSSPSRPRQSASNSSSSGGSSKASTQTRTNTSSATTGSTNDVSDSTSKVVVGAVVAGAVLIAVVAIFFMVKKRKKRQDFISSHYMPPKDFTVKTDAYYYAQPSKVSGFSGAGGNFSCESQHSHSQDSYGSQRYNLESGVIGVGGSMTHFSYEEVMEMTNGFSRQNIIGEGGFGCVFKGQVSDGRTVAVKQLKAGSGQGDREFKAEVEIISRVHHRHLVSLVGYCITDRQRLLLYEFVPNKTLEHHLHAKEVSVLDWSKRLKIAIGSAKGLAYLHEDCHPKIFHRDIKSANILLDDNFEAQVADFGLARLNDSTQTHVSTRVMGTFGYLAPEYASSGKLTDRSDVYSFGVVLLELITGRKPVDPTQPLGDESLVEWARPHLIHAIETGDICELVDPRLEKHYVESEMFRMIETAAACVRHSAPKRPRMVQVVRALDCDMSDLTNGVKYGQSTAYDSGQYNQDIMKFRRMAFSSNDSSQIDSMSGEYTSREVSNGPPISNSPSREVGTQAMRDSGENRYGGYQGNFGSRRNI